MNAGTQRRWPALAAAVVGAAVVLAGCQPSSPTVSSMSTTVAATSPSTGALVTGPGWSPAGIEHLPTGPCHVRVSPDGRELPDPACTPGVADNRVTPDTLSSTICRKGGYTGSVRPPEDVSGPAKRAIMIAYGLDPRDVGRYELDHLVELSDGGSSDGRNLWPQLNVLRDATADPYTKNDKDEVERDVHNAVCTRKISLAAAQQAMATDGTAAKTRLNLTRGNK